VRVSYYSPLPPSRSGIADYSALLLPQLRRHVAVSVARRRWPSFRRSDVAVYHVGNDPEAHGWILDGLRRRPGVVVLHDFVLHHLVAGTTLGRGDAAAYVAAMEREAGAAGRLLAEEVAAGTAPPPWEDRPQEYPLCGEVLELATALIVHSSYVEALARGHGYTRRIHRIPHPVWPVPQVAPERVEGSPVIGAFGHVNPSKRVPQLLRAFARLRATHPDARLVLCGPVSPWFGLEPRIEELGLRDTVVTTGYVDEPRLWSLLGTCDIVVALRAPTMGETSGAALRALVLGKPIVVNDLGWFAELPEEVAARIPVDDREVEQLASALEKLASSPERRAAMAEAARDYVHKEHDVARVAEDYAAALEWAAGGDAVSNAVLAELAQAAADVGIGADSPELVELAARVRELDTV
jgi:glycosyltransferase involved in cell wall biosynthesis